MNHPDGERQVPLIGPLQLRVMHMLWKRGESTVYEVASAVNTEPGATRLAYTTFLTVMRNLARRGMLVQEKTGPGKAHRFRPRVSEHDYKSAFIRQIVDTYYAGDPEIMLRHLGVPRPTGSG